LKTIWPVEFAIGLFHLHPAIMQPMPFNFEAVAGHCQNYCVSTRPPGAFPIFLGLHCVAAL
jgi:hypothetical protein